MHEVKKPFAGIKKLSIWHGKPFFLLQKPFFLKIKPFKKPFFSQSRVDSLHNYFIINNNSYPLNIKQKTLEQSI